MTFKNSTYVQFKTVYKYDVDNFTSVKKFFDNYPI